MCKGLINGEGTEPIARPFDSAQDEWPRPSIILSKLGPPVVGNDFGKGLALGGSESALGVAEGDAVNNLGLFRHVEQIVYPVVYVRVQGGQHATDALAPSGEEQVLGGGYYGGH